MGLLRGIFKYHSLYLLVFTNKVISYLYFIIKYIIQTAPIKPITEEITIIYHPIVLTPIYEKLIL